MSAVELKPQVTGDLAEMEARAIEAIRKGEKFRNTISISGVTALAAIRAAAKEDRDFSNLCSVALAEYSAKHSAELPPNLVKMVLEAMRLGVDIPQTLKRAVKAAS